MIGSEIIDSEYFDPNCGMLCVFIQDFRNTCNPGTQLVQAPFPTYHVNLWTTGSCISFTWYGVHFYQSQIALSVWNQGSKRWRHQESQLQGNRLGPERCGPGGIWGDREPDRKWIRVKRDRVPSDGAREQNEQITESNEQYEEAEWGDKVRQGTL